MTDKYIKLQANQGGPFTAQNNLVDFDLPQGVYNLRDSYVNLNFRITPSDGKTYITDMIWEQSGVSSTNSPRPHFENVAIVRNCLMRCERRGMIEDIRRNDVLKQNLAQYTKSRGTILGESYLSANQIRAPINGNTFSLFQQVYKTGNELSRNLDHVPVPISLNEMFDFCQTDEYDTRRAGRTRVHLECNIDKLEPVRRNVAGGWLTEVNQLINNTIPAAGDRIELKTKAKFANLNASPYYVGMPCDLNGTVAGTVQNRINNKITSIDWNDDKSLSITFETGFSGTAGQVITAITIGNPTALPTLKLECVSAEIVLRQVSNPKGYDQIEYDTFSTEETNGNGRTRFQHQYQVEGEADNVLIMFPTDENNLISADNDVKSWRLRLNNKDLTDRSVLRNSPLAYDRYSMSLISMGKFLRNLTQNGGSSATPATEETQNINWKFDDNPFDKTANDTLTIMNPLNTTEQMKNLQVNIEADGNGVNALILYKHLPRVFSY